MANVGVVKSRSSAHNPMQKLFDAGKQLDGRSRKIETKPKSVNQLEQRRALRHIQSLHQSQKMPIPQLPAVLAYLRWLDKMESWTGKRHPSSINQDHEHEKRNQMYSWSGDFGNPIALPNIKKYPNSEKFSSNQFKEKVFNATPDSSSKRKALTAREYSKNPSYKKSEAFLTLPQYHSSSEPRSKSVTKSKTQSASPRLGGVRYNGKPTPFYIHAKEGFRYWPEELYTPSVHHTKYSFGDRFNPGRFGVITDRIYAKPRSNKHYWTDFQLRQNPIGSGNTVTGSVLKN